jgi:cyclase
MDCDGVKNGYDEKLLSAVCKAINIPVIASGGAGKLEHFYGACKAGASAVLAASLFHFKELTIKQVKKYLNKKRVSVRL